MYFCPCSCAKPDGENEEDVLICLPRNLSYAGESYLDRYSVSSAFVHNPKIDKQLLQSDVEEHYLRAGASACQELLRIEKEESALPGAGQTMADDTLTDAASLSGPLLRGGPTGYDVTCTASMTVTGISPSISVPATTTIPPSFRPYLRVDTDTEAETAGPDDRRCLSQHYVGQPGSQAMVESPDSDMVSEEGIFVNLMDDLDGTEGANCKSTASEASDDTCVSGDSLYYSPEELECLEDEEARVERQQTLEEAVQQAATTLPESLPDHPRAEGASSDLSAKVNDLKITLNDQPFARDDRRQSLLDLVSPDSPLYEDAEFNFTKAELRKSASLKSSKTPPGTPRRKKVVRFADAMGLDLESVRHILNLESPPKIPPSAMKDLQAGLGEDRKEMGTKFLTACFEQPGCDGAFIQRVIGDRVCLENAITVTGSTTITGVIRVANVAFHKNVRVRFTTNSWNTFHDIAASYVQNSCDGPTDRFSFSIVPPADFVPGARVEFAVSLNAGGQEYWDNNRGRNYVFECFAKTIPTEAENSWIHFL